MLGELIGLVAVLGFFGTVWFAVWAVFIGSRQRSAHQRVDARIQELLEQHEQHKKELIDTILHYDTRMEQIERRLAELERARFAAGTETGSPGQVIRRGP
ncbi:MAG: hypothetical protein HY320_16365 [Armatimonadetes bacterium]|nr:hypothetical protein [Armatimonadota bacterium]